LFRDSAYAARRSVHVYDIVPVVDYAAASRVPAVYAYDVVSAYDSAYASRRSVVHAYDIITQQDSADRSGQVTVSVRDILVAPEWFFRVNKALKILERYIPFELVAVSAVPTIYAEDFIAYDFGTLKTVKTVPAFDYLGFDSSIVREVSINAADYLGLDYGSYSKIKAVSILDYVQVSDSIDTAKSKSASASDYLILDSVGYGKSYSPLFFTLFRRRAPIRYVTLNVIDAVSVLDSLNTMAIKTVSASDFVLADSATYGKSYSPLFFTLFRRRIPVRYLTLSVSDRVSVLDSASIVRIKVVSVFDAIAVADYAAVRNIAVRADDYAVISDSASTAEINVVSVADYIAYDYVPHVPPDKIRYRSLYVNVGMRTISVFDRAEPYESVWVGPRVITIHTRDYLVSDGAFVTRRSIHAYDVLMSDNANIVRIA